MRTIPTVITLAAASVAAVTTAPPVQSPTVRVVDESVLREYTGVYEWGPDAFLYLQLWDEFTGFGKPKQLVAFDESGDVRVLYPAGPDRFFAGPGAAIATGTESHIEFQRGADKRIIWVNWQRDGQAARAAKRVDVEKREVVRFSNGDIRFTGALTRPPTAGKHPAIILVHGSGAEDRDYLLPFARFLVRYGMAVLGYDKRGVGGSTGDWNTASFDDLATDVVAAFEYLKTRPDIDRRHVGLLGVSQAGWVMPLAAVRAKDLSFLISVSGAGIPASETTIDQAQNEMMAIGMPPQTVAAIVALMQVQYAYARTGDGWDAYAAARQSLVARLGANVPDSFPGTPDHPYWQFIRRLYFYDPAPALRQLRVPTLALFGELDNNIMAEKNKAAWEAALRASGNRDYTLQVLPQANHYLWQAKTGSNAEMPSLTGFVPQYGAAVRDWLRKRIPAFP